MNDRQIHRAASFKMPAERAPHSRTWMMWPCRTEVWSDIDATRRNCVEVAHAIRRYEPVRMVVKPEDKPASHALLVSDIELFEHPIDDSWAEMLAPVSS